MELSEAGISENTFGTHGAPLAFVPYQGQLAAAEFLNTVWTNPYGIGLLQGPTLSGKSTIIQHFVAALHEDTAAAVIDAAKPDAKGLLNQIIGKFGYELKLESVSELMNLLRVFIMQQAALHDAPLLIVDNAQDLSPDALQVLDDLAAIKVDNGFALRMVFSSDTDFSDVINAPATATLAARLLGTFNMVPMDSEEIAQYVDRKLCAGGCKKPGKIAPAAFVRELHKASGGWPGLVDGLMASALADTRKLPLAAKVLEHPELPESTGRGGLQMRDRQDIEITDAKLYLTYKGRTLREIPLEGERIILGRTEHNDIEIASRFISRNHALFIRDGNVTLLMDLNSTNGTFVNSRRISNHVMVHDDVITVGHHRLKFCDPSAVDAHPLSDMDMDETIIMKSVDDMRRSLARENTRVATVDGKKA